MKSVTLPWICTWRIITQRNTCEKDVHLQYLHNSEKMKTTQISISRRIQKYIMVGSYNQIKYLNINVIYMNMHKSQKENLREVSYKMLQTICYHLYKVKNM